MAKIFGLDRTRNIGSRLLVAVLFYEKYFTGMVEGPNAANKVNPRMVEEIGVTGYKSFRYIAFVHNWSCPLLLLWYTLISWCWNV